MLLINIIAQSEYKFAFEKLDTWQVSRKLTKDIYHITTEFPGEEKFGLVSQLRRAAISVSSNLAEGISRITPKAKANFSEMAYGSLMEVLNQLILAEDLGFIDSSILAKLRIRIQELSNKINAPRKAQLNS